MAIAVFKFAKAAALITLAVLALTHLHQLEHVLWRYVWVDDHRVRLAGAGAFPYAALFLVEGYGLARARHWAEWITVVSTSVFIPFEIFEIAHKPGALRVAALVLNVAAVAYLVARIVVRRQRHRRQRTIAA